MSTNLRHAELDAFVFYDTVAPSRSLEGALREASHGQGGMRRPARCLARNSREAPGKTALPPLRAERANAPMRDPRAPLMCNARRFRQGGSGANNRRGGAPRGERPASWDVGRPRWRLRAYVIRPPTGAAAPERLSALRFPLSWRGNMQTSEDHLPRENDRAWLALPSSARSWAWSRVSLRLGVRYTRSRHDHP